MFYKSLPNGRYRYYQKYYSERERKWKQVSVTLDSKSRQAQAQARRLLEEKIENIEDNLFNVVQNLSVAEVLPEWLAIRKSELKESTYTSQSIIVKKFEKAFGTLRLRDLTNLALQRYLIESKDWSPGYRRLSKIVISLFLDYCVRVGYIDVNPAKKIVLPRNNRGLEDLRKQKEKFLTYSEMKLYLAHIWEHGTNPVLNALTEIMYLTGLRSAEALALGERFTNRENGYFDISYNLYRRVKDSTYYLTSPKTISSYRQVSFNQRVLELIDGLPTKGDFFFLNKRGHPYHLQTFNGYLQDLFATSGIQKGPTFKMTSHVLRHSHITLLVELNVPLRVIMERVGHTDERTTLSVYTHVTRDMQESLSDKLENLDFEVTQK